MLVEITKRLVELYKPDRVYLFGSMARGTNGPDSDYDILVVVHDDAPGRLRKSGPAYQKLWGVAASVDVLVCTRSYFDSRLHLKASLPSVVEDEGELLYAA